MRNHLTNSLKYETNNLVIHLNDYYISTRTDIIKNKRYKILKLVEFNEKTFVGLFKLITMNFLLD